MSEFVYTPGPTGARFMLDADNPVRIIVGPVGGGKSTVALMELVKLAGAQKPNARGVRRTRHIILRNTVAQLKSTVKPLIDYWLVEMAGGQMGQWRLTDNIFRMNFACADGTTVDSELWLMSADGPADVRRLLSVEASSAWVEEAREINRDVFDGLQGRTNRWPPMAMGGATRPGVICSTNMPDIGTFWHEVIATPPAGFGVYIQPPALTPEGAINPGAENLENLAPDYYANLTSGKSQDWIDVYLRNEFGAGSGGQPVFKRSFVRDFHVATENLEPLRGTNAPLVVGMDNGLQAAASLWQRDMRGRCNIIDECYVPADQTMGVESFLDNHLIPKISTEWKFPANKVVFSVDPACFERSQINEDTIAQAIMRRGYFVIKAPTNIPERRISAVEALLARQVDGKAALLVSPRCKHTIAALSWGYKYGATRDGAVKLVPEKNHYSHTADAVQYAALNYTAEASLSLTGQRPARRIERVNYMYA